MALYRDLILTGWGHNDYVAAAAAALRALDCKADVYGVSQRRLPEMLAEEAARNEPRWRRIHILGVGLDGQSEKLQEALVALKVKGVEVEWISAIAMPEELAGQLKDVLEVHCREALLPVVAGEVFGTAVEDLMPYLEERAREGSDEEQYFKLFATAGFYHRNYQDDKLFADTVWKLAKRVKPENWDKATRDAVDHYERYGSRELLGKSKAIEALKARIDKVARHEHARVLILGESGTGKETVAQFIHNKSPRRRKEFRAFNCASVAKDILEDRLFGHEKGAFTDAIEQTDGLFALADGGTLFLDEIGEMSLELQALLLRVLEGGRFMRLGGREELKCDVRLITATNRDLPKLVREGKFRADLYQRINVVQLKTPSLRERKEDIPVIANDWWRKFHNKAVLKPDQVKALMDYDYPGNVRELINILDKATALEEDDFEELMREHKEINAGLFEPAEEDAQAPDKLDDAIRLHVRRVCGKCGGNITKAAEALGISRNTLKRYLE